MNIVSTLSERLLQQPFTENEDEVVTLARHKEIAYIYSKIENSMAVLSDLKSETSYIYNGGTAKELGIAERDSFKIIKSIWEKDIFNRIHPNDLMEKHLLELQFFHLLKSLPVEERSDYHIASKMRMKNRSGEYVTIQHRMFYVCSCPLGNLWLALCLYNYPYSKITPEQSNGIIINSATGNIIKPDKKNCNSLLSEREKEILQLIDGGKLSKEIAGILSISINTVNRHRQNILEKLRAKNSIEACNISKLMELI